MQQFTAVIEKCPETGLFVGYIPGFPWAHSQGETPDELNRNLKEVIEMLLEGGMTAVGAVVQCIEIIRTEAYRYDQRLLR